MSQLSNVLSSAAPRRADNVETAPRISEDWLSLVVGLLIFALSLGALANVDLLGWAVTIGMDRCQQGTGPGLESLCIARRHRCVARNLRRTTRHPERYGDGAEKRSQALRSVVHSCILDCVRRLVSRQLWRTSRR